MSKELINEIESKIAYNAKSIDDLSKIAKQYEMLQDVLDELPIDIEGRVENER